MTAQGRWFGLKAILIDSISGSYMFADFYMNSNKCCPLPGRLNLYFGSENAQKLVFFFKMTAQGPWFGLKTILINSISGSILKATTSPLGRFLEITVNQINIDFSLSISMIFRIYTFYKNPFYKNHRGTDLVKYFTKIGESLMYWTKTCPNESTRYKQRFYKQH